MKLIDILLEELPKRGGWPGEQSRCWRELHPEGFYIINFPTLKHCFTVDDDKHRSVGVDFVTKSEYEAALAAKNENDLAKISVVEGAEKLSWNGEGLPPVGVECTIDDWGSRYKRKSCHVLFISKDTYVVEVDGSEFSGSTKNIKFLPALTESDIKREVAIDVMKEIIGKSPSDKPHQVTIYDAIAEGKIPGIKLED